MSKLAATIIGLSILVGAAPHSLPMVDSKLTLVQEKTFPANATVVNVTANDTKRLGIVTNPQLRFGTIPEGAKSHKFLLMNAPKKSLVLVDSEGNISEFLDFERKIYFKGQEELRILFNGSKTGFYTGEVRLKTQAPKDRWGERWLDFKYQYYPY
jgi:hypothetical protein